MPFLFAVFGFRGRARRAVFWFTTICCEGALVLLVTGPKLPEDFVLPLLVAAFFLLEWPATAVIVRRRHDRGKSAWWLLPYAALPIGPYVVTIYMDAGEIPKRVGNFLLLVAFIDLGVIPGTPGPNRYGPDPRSEPIDIPPTTL